MSFNTGAAFTIAKSGITYLFSAYLTVSAVLLASRGKYKGQAKLPLNFGFILYPFFLLLQIPLDLTAIFLKEVKWKKIPHGQ